MLLYNVYEPQSYYVFNVSYPSHNLPVESLHAITGRQNKTQSFTVPRGHVVMIYSIKTNYH